MNEPFPFFGAGNASVFELVTVSVVFDRPPAPAEQETILRDLPTLLTESVGWEGDALEVGSVQCIGIVPAGRAQKTLARQIEAWLIGAHTVVPVLFALRLPDEEAGGTSFSNWHRNSVARLADPGLAERLARLDPGSRAGGLLVDALTMVGPPLPEVLAERIAPVPLAPSLLAGDRVPLRRALAGADREERAAELVRALDLTDGTHRGALLDARQELASTNAGFDALVLAAALDPGGVALDDVLRNRYRFGRSPAACLVHAVQGRPPEVAMAVLAVGLLRPDTQDDLVLLSVYLWSAVVGGASSRVDEGALRRALAASFADPSVGLNVTAVLLEQRACERLVDHVAQLRAAGAAVDPGVHLNEAQALASLGRTEPAAAAADRALASGDLGGHLVRAALLADHDRAAAIAEIRCARDAGYPSLAGWVRDPLLASMHGDPAYEAAFLPPTVVGDRSANDSE